MHRRDVYDLREAKVEEIIPSILGDNYHLPWFTLDGEAVYSRQRDGLWTNCGGVCVETRPAFGVNIHNPDHAILMKGFQPARYSSLAYGCGIFNSVFDTPDPSLAAAALEYVKDQSKQHGNNAVGAMTRSRVNGNWRVMVAAHGFDWDEWECRNEGDGSEEPTYCPYCSSENLAQSDYDYCDWYCHDCEDSFYWNNESNDDTEVGWCGYAMLETDRSQYNHLLSTAVDEWSRITRPLALDASIYGDAGQGYHATVGCMGWRTVAEDTLLNYKLKGQGLREHSLRFIGKVLAQASSFSISSNVSNPGYLATMQMIAYLYESRPILQACGIDTLFPCQMATNANERFHALDGCIVYVSDWDKFKASSYFKNDYPVHLDMRSDESNYY